MICCNMIITSAEFITSAVKPSQYPQELLPEIAFVGRSNVGKSACINTLLNRKKLVKTSSKPGRTQLINFFQINRSFFMVDLPGYGYAKVPAAIKKKWGPMVETYLGTRQSLRGVVLILDIRRTPSAADIQMIAWLARFQHKILFILTKTDKLSKTRQHQQHAMITERIAVQADDLVLFSAKSRLGKARLWETIEKVMA